MLGGVCNYNSITHTGSDHELGQLGSKLVKARAKRANLKAYGITAPFWAEIFCFVFVGVEGGVFALQPHREVRPGSKLG